SRFSKNFGGHFVGALYLTGGVVFISETTFDGNSADGAGAILVDNSFNTSPTLIVSDSAFVENQAGGAGGGAAISNGLGGFAGGRGGTVQVTNTTFANNSYYPFLGTKKGIVIANSGTLSLTNSTLAGNTVNPSLAGPFSFFSVISSETNARTFLQN